MTTLSERQNKYEQSYDYMVLPGIPVVVRAEVRNFSRLTRNLSKPISPELWKIMRETMFTTVMDIEGCIFSYHHGPEMSFVLRDVGNSDFYSNRVQKMCSVVSSMCSINFMKHFLASDDPPDILGEAVFEVTVTGLPGDDETLDYLLWRQQVAVSNSVNAVVEYEMLKNSNGFGSIHRKSISEKKNLLHDECGVNYEDFPSYFRLGSACYKAPKIFQNGEEEIAKKKWTLDSDVPDFLDNKDFVMNIIHTGQDVMRPDRDIIPYNEE